MKTPSNPEGARELIERFDLEGEAWVERVRRADRSAGLGSIGPYELLDEVREGAQGVVYRARRDAAGPIVALKRLAQGSFATEEARRRFEREREAAAELSHPAIVGVHGVEDIEGHRVLCMEWVDGVPIDCYVADEIPEREPRRVLALFLQLCDAVQHAHQNGVLHRDLKPSNVLVDREGRPRLLDFGLARRLAPEQADELTSTGQVLGTLAYAAPEQLADSREADVRADVHALGAMLYELLSGELPFGEPRALVEWVQQLDQREPRPLGRLAPAAGAELERILVQALRNEPEQRYASVAEFGADLRRHLAGEPILADAPGALLRMRKAARRHRALSSALVLLALFALVLGWNARRHAAELGRKQQELEGALEEARTRTRQAQQTMVFLLHEILGRADPFYGGKGLTVREVLDATEQRLELLDSYSPMSRMILRDSLTGIYRGLDELERAELHAREALALDAELHGSEPPHGLTRRGVLGEILAEQGEFEEAAAVFAGMDAHLDPPEGEPRFHLDSLCDKLAGYALLRGDSAEAVALFQRSIEEYRTNFEAEVTPLDPVWRGLALALLDLGRGSEAAELLHAVFEREPDGPGLEAYPRARQRLALARIELERGELERAEELARTSLAALRAHLEPTHAHLVDAQFDLALVLLERGERAEAAELVESGLAALRPARPQVRARGLELRERLQP